MMRNLLPAPSSAGRETRILRDRSAALTDAIDAQTSSPGAYGVARLALQVYNGGAMPTSAGHFFLGNPVLFTGNEAEGTTDGGSADTGTSIPFLVLGTTTPTVGDILTAYGVGNRWVAERGGSSGGTLHCSPCNIPESNLTLSWVNNIIGNGSTTLAYTVVGPSKSWQSACTSNLLFDLFCTAGLIEFRVIFFTSGSCPGGVTGYCSNLSSSPFGLTLASYTCLPLSLVFHVTFN